MYPKNAVVVGGPIDFQFSSDDMIDLGNTDICMRVRIVKNQADPIGVEIAAQGKTTPGDYVAPVNNLLHSMFQGCKMHIGDVEMEESYNLYAYAAYLDTLLNTTKEEQESVLTSQMWLKDNVDDMDYTIVGNYDDAKQGKKKGAQERMLRIVLQSTSYNKKGIWLSGRPACDMFRQDKYIPSNTMIRLSLFPHIIPSFWYMCNKEEQYQMKIEEVFLEVRTVKIIPSVQKLHETVITKHPAEYAISRKIAIPFTANKGDQSVRIQDPTRGRFPKKLYVGFVDTHTYEGLRTKNPFNFENVAISSMQLFFNGEVFRPAFNSTETEVNYNALFTHGQVNITPTEFKKGFALYAFYPLASFDESRRSGITQLAITFASALPKNYKIIVYYECDDEVKIRP